jgi:glycosyltransferase involved in cell wall biosynthesis
VVSNGIDLKRFSGHNDGKYLKQKLALPDAPTFLFVGRLDKEKNIDVFIKALSLLKDSYQFHAVIVGQGKEEKPLKSLALELGVLERLTFTGYLPKKDLPNIYDVADIFVMPSIAELQSLVTMEAMASGLPVVGADAVALPHLIHDGVNGFLFHPGNESDMAAKLAKLLSDTKLRKKMGEESLILIKAHDVSQVVEKVEEIYKKVIQEYKKKASTQTQRSVKAIKSSKSFKPLKRLLPQQI